MPKKRSSVERFKGDEQGGVASMRASFLRSSQNFMGYANAPI